MNKSEIKDAIVAEIKKHDIICLFRHKRADGDCIGASLALKCVLKESFPEKQIYAVGGNIPSDLSFMGKEDEYKGDVSSALAIVLDTSVKERIFGDIKGFAKVIKIDHHLGNDNYGDINYVDEKSPACCEIVYDIVRTYPADFVLPKRAARLLLAGMITDTGRFRFAGVSNKTFFYAGELMERGIILEDLYSELYTKNLNTLKLEGYILSHFKTTPAGVAYIHITEKICKKFSVAKEEAANLINVLENIRGSLIWIFFVDYAGETRVRLRSRHIPVVGIAEMFNGGGHLNASGATLYKAKQAKELLKAADDALKLFKEKFPEKQ